jgi:hypothetical protein
MAEANQIVFSHKEVAESLVKQHGINEGLWSLYIEFGIGAANVGPNDQELNPSALVPVLKIGLQRTDKLSNLTVDAAIVNPATKSKPKATK